MLPKCCQKYKAKPCGNSSNTNDYEHYHDFKEKCVCLFQSMWLLVLWRRRLLLGHYLSLRFKYPNSPGCTAVACWSASSITSRSVKCACGPVRSLNKL